MSDSCFIRQKKHRGFIVGTATSLQSHLVCHFWISQNTKSILPSEGTLI